MRTPADVIQALESTPGRLDKERIVLDAWNAGITQFFEGAHMAYDALRTYNVKKVPLIQDEDDPLFQSTFTWERFKDLAKGLETREITGNAARDALKVAADSSSVRDWNWFFRRVLLKDFKCGITETTINKVLEKVGGKAKDYIIPVFSCQLAKPAEDNQKHMRGAKLIDVKLDGVRVLSVLDKDKGDVVQFTREGRVNDNFPHIAAQLAKLIPHIKESMVLDGEMVSRSFQALMTQLNRATSVDTTDAKLALFDCLPLRDFMAGECQLTQVQRHEALVMFMPLLEKASGGAIYVVPKLSVNLDTDEGQASFREFNREAVEAGYEGIMIKDPASTYQTKRTVSWLKIKPKLTIDLEVVDFEPGKAEGKFAETLGGMVCEGEHDGKRIRVTVGGGYSEDLRDWIWANQGRVLGLIAEIETDAITKPKTGELHGLRFPQFARFRGFNPGEKM